MAAKKETKKAVSATLPTGTKVTASQEVIDKLQRSTTSSKSSSNK